MSFLQEHPHWLEVAYQGVGRALRPFRGWLKPGGNVERVFVLGEQLTKGPLFQCQMCGSCVLHQTGMTCPMNCPKNMRNGPCGGVRPDGHCEIKPEMTCVWLLAWERAAHMPTYGHEIQSSLPPLDRRLQGSSAWINDFTGAANRLPKGWRA